MKDHLEYVKTFHDLESACYADERYNDKSCEGLSYITRKSIILELIERIPKTKYLDIGCGPGILTSELLNGKKEIFSIDLSFQMLMNAVKSIRDNPSRAKAWFSSCEASHICFRDKSFDAVLCIGVIFYVEDYIAVMKEIRRVLDEKGITIVQINKIALPSVYKTLVPAYRWLKTKYTGKRYDEMKFKRNVFSYKRFIEDMKTIGYDIGLIEYYDFRVPFLDISAPKLSVKFGKWLFNHRKMNCFRWLSHGMLISLTKYEY